MDLLQSFRDFIAKENLFSGGDRLLIAVSGGLDSVVLCELCHRTGYDFSMAHGNFQLRGEESERDEQFVRRLAEKQGRELFVKRFDTQEYMREKRVSVQVAARELRYAWFREIAGGSLILTAHHLDDNIETLLMNFFKGTGIAGLRGILPKQGGIVRPLLFAGKEQIRQFATEQQLAWVEDSSNASDKYSRNYLRHELIPLVERLYPGVLGNLGDNIGRFREIETLYRQSVERHRAGLMERKGEEVHIPVLKLKKSAPLNTIVYEIIREYGYTPQQVEDVVRLLDSESGKQVSSATHRILKNRNWLIVAPLQNLESVNILIESANDRVDYADGVLVIKHMPVGEIGSVNNGNSIALLDASTIRFPLLLRKWRPGDYFYPLGMRKKKKLGRFFIDNKLSLADKEKVWVLEMDKKIVWVVGLRIDDRFRVVLHTREVLKIEIEARLA